MLNLPWELVELAPDLPVGCDAASAGRSPSMDATAAAVAFRPGPLRILFLASAPTDQGQLDFEREEDAMLRATAQLQNVSIYFAEAGTFDELKELVAECRPHVVHLSGHGTVDKDGMGSFAFEPVIELVNVDVPATSLCHPVEAECSNGISHAERGNELSRVLPTR